MKFTIFYLMHFYAIVKSEITLNNEIRDGGGGEVKGVDFKSSAASLERRKPTYRCIVTQDREFEGFATFELIVSFSSKPPHLNLFNKNFNLCEIINIPQYSKCPLPKHSVACHFSPKALLSKDSVEVQKNWESQQVY